MAEKVLIAGGSGMIGNHLAEKLMAQGHSVSLLSRNPDKVSGVNAYHWDPDKGAFDEQALQDTSVIVNLAGAGIADKRWNAERKKLLLESRTKSTSLLRNELKSKDHNVKTYINASAIGYYGFDNGDRWQKEDSRFGDDFLATVTKAWEEEANKVSEIGIRTVLLRIGIVLSNDGGALPEISRPVKFGAGAALGSGDQWMSWIHIDDLIGMIIFAINEEKVSGIYNAVAPIPVTNKEFTKITADKMSKPFFLPNVPAFALRAALGEMSSMLLGSNRISADKIKEAGYEFKYSIVNKALEDLLKKS